MKKKVYARPIYVILTDEMFGQIKGIKDQGSIGLSDYIREAIQEKMKTVNNQNKWRK